MNFINVDKLSALSYSTKHLSYRYNYMRLVFVPLILIIVTHNFVRLAVNYTSNDCELVTLWIMNTR
jgi:hypothetical protein